MEQQGTKLTRSELLSLLCVLDEVRGGASSPGMVHLTHKLEQMRDETLSEPVKPFPSSTKRLIVIGLQDYKEYLPHIQAEVCLRFDQVDYVALPMEYGALKQRVLAAVLPGERSYLLIDWVGLHDQGLDVGELDVEVLDSSLSAFGTLRAAQFPEGVLNVALFLCERTGKIPVLISLMHDVSKKRFYNVWYPADF